MSVAIGGTMVPPGSGVVQLPFVPGPHTMHASSHMLSGAPGHSSQMLPGHSSQMLPGHSSHMLPAGMVAAGPPSIASMPQTLGPSHAMPRSGLHHGYASVAELTMRPDFGHSAPRMAPQPAAAPRQQDFGSSVRDRLQMQSLRTAASSFQGSRFAAPDVQAVRAEHALVCNLQAQLDQRLSTLERITEGAVLRNLDKDITQPEPTDGTFKHEYLPKPLHGYYVQRNAIDRREKQLVLLDEDRHSCPEQILWLAGMA
eukprot:TRINITY_DN2960_c0_g1_i1.p1 TRINITY_DN2960_c0_g1~~TRINITY_DN2960_c0_g1_i1.p1  ORF type:complete len:256 (-),score=24.46 TRINITY_DN2960_c0_g1_i1:13-780(-)